MFTTEQIRSLERAFTRHNYITSATRYELAKSLNINEKCIKTWFQNRRMKEKRESSESSSDSSSESPDSETPSVPASPPPQVKPEASKTEYINHQYYNCDNSEYSYQLPPYYEMHQNMYEAEATHVSAFYNDTTVYPTQYYPVGMSYPCVEGNVFTSEYGSDMNHYWAANNNYYAQI